MNFNPFNPFSDSFGAAPKSPDYIFAKRKQGGGIAPRRKQEPPTAEEDAEPEVLEEAETPEQKNPEKKSKVKLTNLKWSVEEGQFNTTVSISVDAEVPEEHKHLTRITFDLIALVREGERESILKLESHLKEGKATAEVTLYWPQHRENGELLRKCDYIFTAKHKESEEAESIPIVVSAPPKLVGTIWMKLISPKGFPLVGLDCGLKGGTNAFPRKETDKDGMVQWTSVPFGEYALELKAGSNTQLQPSPWLQDQIVPHIQQVRRLDRLLGPPASVLGVQVRLKALGYDCGNLDGIMGPKTNGAIQKFQGDRKIAVDGSASAEIQDQLVFCVGA